MLNLPQEIIVMGGSLPAIPVFLSLGFCCRTPQWTFGNWRRLAYYTQPQRLWAPHDPCCCYWAHPNDGNKLTGLLRHRKHGNVDFKVGGHHRLSMILSVGLGKVLTVHLEKTKPCRNSYSKPLHCSSFTGFL